MIVIVCGGRNFSERDFLFRALDAANSRRPISEVVHGLCPTGADAMAADWAASRGIPCTGFMAEWGAVGRRAGPLRNQRMLDYGVDGVIAFPGGAGTADMVRRAKSAGVTVWEPKCTSTT